MDRTRRQVILGGSALLLPANALAQAAMPGMPEHAAAPATAPAAARPLPGADHRIEIGTGIVDLGKDISVSTRLYNGRFPGPLLRLTQGKRVVVDIHNNTDTPEQLHWHGQFLSPDVDGAAEEGTPFIPPRGRRRIAFTPTPPGFRFYHTHIMAGTDLSLGFYSGLAGLAYIEPRREAGAYDRGVFLTLKEFGPYFSHMEMISSFLLPDTRVRQLFEIDQVSIREMTRLRRQPGYELGYQYHTINGRMLGQGEPIRVKQGERLLLRILNASATEIRSLALPGHQFEVIALDGNPVPRPARVPMLWIAPGERICAIVEMRQPGVWILGDIDEDARTKGMGIVVEYASRKGDPQWQPPARANWDYRWFARPGAVARQPDETIQLTFGTRYSTRNGFDEFTINGKPFSMETRQPSFALRYGRRYRLHMRNATDDTHPIHLHRHTFEVTSVAGAPTAGVMKDVVMLGGFQEMTVDFTADQLGPSLLHCHMQNHMDLGFMALFNCRR